MDEPAGQAKGQNENRESASGAAGGAAAHGDTVRLRAALSLQALVLLLLALLVVAYVLAFFVFGLDLQELRRWGYAGIFLIAMAGSATIVLPTPSSVAIFGGGALLEPAFGLPAPLLVGLVAGLGDAVGELSGYALGYAGQDLVREGGIFETFRRWMTTRGTVTVFLLSTFPNPLFDVAGAAAGAARMPAARFFAATLCGKIIKDLFLAYGGSFSIGLLGDAL